MLAVIGAIGIAALYDARQDYEDRLADDVGAGGRGGEPADGGRRARGQPRADALAPRPRRFVARAAAGSTRGAERVAPLARDDGASRALGARIAPAARAARVLARGPARDPTRAQTRGACRPCAARCARSPPARSCAATRRATRARRSRSALISIALGAGLALVAVLAFLTLLIRTMRRPLDDLVGATRRMAGGDLAVRVETDGPQELAALGESFNLMSADLAAAGARVESQRQRLATTISSLGDGLVICDARDVVVDDEPARPPARRAAAPGRPAHGPRSPLPPLDAALAGEVTIEHGGVMLAVTAARLSGPDGGVVWTLRDITERARLEQAKSDFVATASHELRSPLTSIKGFIELLGTTENENLTPRQLDFIQIALQSTDRLVDLVNDLLDVARIESGQFEIQSRSCDLRATVEEVAALMRRASRTSASGSSSRSPSRARRRSPTPCACARSS